MDGPSTMELKDRRIIWQPIGNVAIRWSNAANSWGATCQRCGSEVTEGSRATAIDWVNTHVCDPSKRPTLIHF